MKIGGRARTFVLTLGLVTASIVLAIAYVAPVRSARAVPVAFAFGLAAAALLTLMVGAAIERVRAPGRETATSLTRKVGDLRSERDLLRRIIDGMHEGVLLLDKDGRLALMNPAFREMLLLPSDVIGQPLLDVVRHAELKELLDRARVSKATCSGEIELSGLKPRRLLVRGTSLPGEADGLLAVFFDVTEIRRLESLRRDFVANVSHELRTPVTAVLSAAETLRGPAAAEPEAANQFLTIIERNAERLQRLIEDLLDLSRIESRELRLSPDSFALGPFVNQLASTFRERADKKRIRLAVDVPPELKIRADRRALEQVLANLVDNAVKYCPDGAEVRIHAESLGKVVKLSVDDTGAGIEPAHLPRLFERFYRADAGRSRQLGGTGLGLSIVKHLVEAMSGSVEVESTLGRGTSFRIELPADGGTPTVAQKPAESP